MNIDGNTVQIVGLTGGGTDGGNVTLGSGVIRVGYADSTYAGVISGSGSVEKKGAFQTTLTGANTYTGGTVIHEGQLKIGANNTLTTTGAVSFAGSKPTANLWINSGVEQTIGNLTGVNPNSVINTVGTLIVTQSNAGNYAGKIFGHSGTFKKAGSAALTISNPQAYRGLVEINAGTLTIGADSSFQNTVTLANTAGAILNIGANTVYIKGITGGGGSGGNIANNGGIISVSNTISSGNNFNGGFTGTGTLTVVAIHSFGISGTLFAPGDYDFEDDLQ